MDQGSVFKSNRSQAVRLPKSVAFPDDVKKVDVIVVGNARLLAPAGEAWTTWFDGPGVSEDFMVERDQPLDQERSSLQAAMRYMLDTNVAIHTIRHRPREVRAKFIARHERMCVSTVSLMELICGAEKSTQPDRNLRDVEAFASRLRILPYDREAAMHAGRIRAALAGVGTPIGPYDQIIAGHARSRGLIVVTTNTDELERVPGISVEDWTEADVSL